MAGTIQCGRRGRKDFGKMPNEDAVMEALRRAGVGRGDYMFPCPSTPGDMRSPEMCEKYKGGPSGIMTIMPPGLPKMGKSLVLWFLYCAAVGVFVAYLTGRTLMIVFGIFVGVLAIQMLATGEPKPTANDSRARSWLLIAAGLSTGLLAGLLGSGGVLIVPSLVLLGGVAIHRAIATSLPVIYAISVAAISSHLLAGQTVPMIVAAWFVAGASMMAASCRPSIRVPSASPPSPTEAAACSSAVTRARCASGASPTPPASSSCRRTTSR